LILERTAVEESCLNKRTGVAVPDKLFFAPQCAFQAAAVLGPNGGRPPGNVLAGNCQDGGRGTIAEVLRMRSDVTSASMVRQVGRQQPDSHNQVFQKTARGIGDAGANEEDNARNVESWIHGPKSGDWNIVRRHADGTRLSPPGRAEAGGFGLSVVSQGQRESHG
jgi:hypothetical protein